MMVFLAIFLSHTCTCVAQVFLKGGIDDKLLANRVPSKLPGELVAKPCLVIVIVGIDHLIVVLFKLAMILDDCC